MKCTCLGLQESEAEAARQLAESEAEAARQLAESEAEAAAAVRTQGHSGLYGLLWPVKHLIRNLVHIFTNAIRIARTVHFSRWCIPVTTTGHFENPSWRGTCFPYLAK